MRETVRNFRRELKGDEDDRNARLRAMRRELFSARQRLLKVESERDRVRAAEREACSERDSARRRAELARRAGDTETAGIADDFAARNARRARVLRKKADALHAEIGWLRDELEEMRQRLERRAANEGTARSNRQDSPPV